MVFVKAVKKQHKLRMGLFAPSGAGKTFTSLKLAKAFGPKIACIDTENESSSKYIGAPGIPDYDIASMTYGGNAGQYVATLIDHIESAQDEYDCLIVDSLTHAWEATKDEVDAAAKRMRTPNSFAAWKEGTTLWGRLLRAIVMCRTNIICCARSKTSYEQSENNGKKQVKKVGMAPELRDGMEYEFDIVGEMDVDHNLIITKSRCHLVDNNVTKCPDEKWMLPVINWLSSGVVDHDAEKKRLYAMLGEDERIGIVDKCTGKTTEEQIAIMQEVLK